MKIGPAEEMINTKNITQPYAHSVISWHFTEAHAYYLLKRWEEFFSKITYLEGEKCHDILF
jgi:hypothetical protein